MPEWNLAEPVNFSLEAGEHLAIVGSNASGKTLFADMLTGKHPLKNGQPVFDFSPSQKKYVSDNIRYISFQDAYGDKVGKSYYLQQRWNMHDIDEETPTVGSSLENVFLTTTDQSEGSRRLRDKLYDVFHIEPMLGKYVISLSSGELRKFHLVKNLMSAPRILVLDNPFIGLDAETRESLKQLLGALAGELTLQVILVLAYIDDIPPFITHVVEVSGMRASEKKTREQFIATHAPEAAGLSEEEKQFIEQSIAAIPYDEASERFGNTDASDRNTDTSEIVKLTDVNVRYGERTILKDLNWTVCQGERWAIKGQNGAGKSTLLSLVCADNPQSYACDIELFGRSRGSGESIWEIKKHIGYVSPELHRSYKHNIPAMRIVASGMKDSVGLYVTPDDEEYAKCEVWMKIFGLESLAQRDFQKMSSGEQRLVLLARAFVKDPQLLILDEPMHGLDNHNKQKVKHIIECFSHRRGKTIIMVSHYTEDFPPCISKTLQLVKH